MTKPHGAASSVFDMGRLAKAPERAARVAPPVSAVKIVSGVPIPPARAGANDTYGEILARMKDGDMVELEAAQGNQLRSRAHKAGVEVTLRKTDDGKVRVWRVGLRTSSSNA